MGKPTLRQVNDDRRSRSEPPIDEEEYDELFGDDPDVMQCGDVPTGSDDSDSIYSQF